jgi:hypothetical protein
MVGIAHIMDLMPPPPPPMMEAKLFDVSTGTDLGERIAAQKANVERAKHASAEHTKYSRNAVQSARKMVRQAEYETVDALCMAADALGQRWKERSEQLFPLVAYVRALDMNLSKIPSPLRKLTKEAIQSVSLSLDAGLREVEEIQKVRIALLEFAARKESSEERKTISSLEELDEFFNAQGL